MARAKVIIDQLSEMGETPVVFGETKTRPSLFADVPFISIPRLWDAPYEKRKQVMDEILRYTEFSQPAILFEDTHPVQYWSAPDRRCYRILLVRPTTYKYLAVLNNNFGSEFDLFLIADSKESPTWPYSQEQTVEIKSRPKWKTVGPVFRVPSRSELQLIDKKYSLDSAKKLCVVFIGAGEVREGFYDGSSFIQGAADALSHFNREEWNIVFVRGPYANGLDFPDSTVRSVDEEPLMPALFALANVAIIRPEYNSVWECVHGGTPFLPLLSAFYEEPWRERLERLKAIGAVVEDAKQLADTAFQVESQHRMASHKCRWNGKANEAILKECLGQCEDFRKVKTYEERRKRILLVSINGIGIGHIERSLEIAKHLRSLDIDTHLIIHCNRWQLPEGAIPVPYTVLPPFWDRQEAEECSKRLDETISSFDPDGIVYDYHRPIPDWVSRKWILRFRCQMAVYSLPSESTLKRLLTTQAVNFIWLLHSKSEIEACYGLETVNAIENSTVPIDLTGSVLPLGGNLQIGLPSLMIPHNHFIVFSLGGGGEHPGLHEIEAFGKHFNAAAESLHADGYKIIFIGGPYFNHYDEISSCVEVVTYLQNPQEILKRAELVVIRPGFNTLKLCLSVAKRLAILKTTVYEEATYKFCQPLEMANEISTIEITVELLKQVKNCLSRPERDLTKWRKGPGVSNIARKVRDAVHGHDPWRDLKRIVKGLRTAPKVFLRVDDVVSLDCRTRRLLEFLGENCIPASLEIVPYHCKLRETDLEAFDPTRTLLEVGQHGYSHMSAIDQDGKLCEFHPQEMSEHSVTALKRGFDFLSDQFGPRFSKGYSPPYDTLPLWLPRIWQVCGGSHLSLIWCRPKVCPLPILRVCVELWDWTRRKPKSTNEVIAEISSAALRQGVVGIVLHLQNYQPDKQNCAPNWENLLLSLIESGFLGARSSDLIRVPAETLFYSTSRLYATDQR